MKNLAIFLFLPFLIFCNVETQNTEKDREIEVEKKKILDNSTNNTYSWKEDYAIENKLVNRINVPNGYERKTNDKKAIFVNSLMRMRN